MSPEMRNGAPAQRPAREESPTDHQATEPVQDSAPVWQSPAERAAKVLLELPDEELGAVSRDLDGLVLPALAETPAPSLALDEQRTVAAVARIRCRRRQALSNTDAATELLRSITRRGAA